MFEYVWWEFRLEIEKIVADAQGDWNSFKKEMQRKYKLGDGLLTIDQLHNINRNDFTTIGVFATAFEKMAERVPGLSEEMQCVIFLGKISGYETMELTRGGASGRKTSWETIKRNLASRDLDQVFRHQVKMERKKRKEIGVIQGADSALGGVLSSMETQLKELKDKVESGKVMAVGQTSNKMREGQQRLRQVTKDFDGMPVYKKEDTFRMFLREFEEYAFRREWDTQLMLLKVTGLGECNKEMDEIVSDCLGWMTFKAEMWAKYGDLTKDEIEDDIIFDGTNLEDFEDSIDLFAEKRRWGENKKLEQLMTRIAPRESEVVRKVRGRMKETRHLLNKGMIRQGLKMEVAQ
ncbi:hypothetical protein CBR_g34697 [Chara braunii]|uniref:Retrotransposon gag domain-containing protein n=1 Tax=Chara braunii TaxID=69332 RepID=A0A388JZ00_CHABU|nr:hypothetical protein CBR_g34697 [Chara braunii]|eukprot:GBG62997.1 hypothetical protein CBR_g34697 [Chara braunii]